MIQLLSEISSIRTNIGPCSAPRRIFFSVPFTFLGGYSSLITPLFRRTGSVRQPRSSCQKNSLGYDSQSASLLASSPINRPLVSMAFSDFIPLYRQHLRTSLYGTVNCYSSWPAPSGSHSGFLPHEEKTYPRGSIRSGTHVGSLLHCCAEVRLPPHSFFHINLTRYSA